MRFIPKLGIAGGLALCASVAGPVAASQAAPPTATIHAVIGIGTWSGGSLFGTPTLAVGATTNGMATGGDFSITYPPDAQPAGSTAVRGTVTCLDVVNGGTAYIAGLIKSSSGPRSGIFPVGDYITMGVQADALNFNAGQPTSPGPDCGAVTPNLTLTSGHFFAR
jgi:hypothetical protein